MRKKQWNQPEIKEINIKNTESGDVQFIAEGTWYADDKGIPPVHTHS